MRLLYQDEIQVILGCSRPTLNKIIKSGEFPLGRVIDGRVAWLDDDVREFIDALPHQRFTGRVGRPKTAAA